MSGSRNRPRAAGALLAVLLFTCGSAIAEEVDSEAPIRLVPPNEIEQPQFDASPLSEPAGELLILEAEDLGEPKTSVETDGDQVKVGKLNEIDADAVGLLSESSGGYPDSLWHGSRRDRVMALLPRLPVEARSPAMRSAALKLLLSSGEAPSGEVIEKGRLLRLRAELLARMGEYDVAIALLQASPSGGFEEIIARYDSDRMFLKLDFVGACGKARTRIDISPLPYWQRALIFCQSRSQEVEAASLGLDLLRESDSPPSAAFVTLINAMNGYGEAVLDSLPNPTPMLVSMLRVLNIPAPADALDVANPALLRVFASTSDSDIELRLAAAEEAEAVGALPAESIGLLYAAVAFSSEELANPIEYSADMTGPLARAILYQAILAEDVPTARAEAIGITLERAREEGRFATMARALLSAIQVLPATQEFAWFAAEAGRAYFAANRWEEAGRWFNLALAESGTDLEAQQAAVQLWPLVALSGEKIEVDEDMLDAWWEYQGSPLGPTTHQRGALLLTLLAATGHEISSEQWDALLAGPLIEPSAVTSPALRHALSAAADNGRIGETVLLALLGLGSGGPQNSGVATLGETISALRAAGLVLDAHAIAVEAALASGL